MAHNLFSREKLTKIYKPTSKELLNLIAPTISSDFQRRFPCIMRQEKWKIVSHEAGNAHIGFETAISSKVETEDKKRSGRSRCAVISI